MQNKTTPARDADAPDAPDADDSISISEFLRLDPVDLNAQYGPVGHRKVGRSLVAQFSRYPYPLLNPPRLSFAQTPMVAHLGLLRTPWHLAYFPPWSNNEAGSASTQDQDSDMDADQISADSQLLSELFSAANQATATQYDADSFKIQSRAFVDPETDEPIDEPSPPVLSIELKDAEPTGGPVSEESELCCLLRRFHGSRRVRFWLPSAPAPTPVHAPVFVPVPAPAPALAPGLWATSRRLGMQLCNMAKFWLNPIAAVIGWAPILAPVASEETTMRPLTRRKGRRSTRSRSRPSPPRPSPPRPSPSRLSRPRLPRAHDDHPLVALRLPTSPSTRLLDNGSVLRALNATPIRRRRSFQELARQRRNEANGRIERTLFRLPELLAQKELDRKAQSEVNHVGESEVNNRAQDEVNGPSPAGRPVIANPGTPERAGSAAPVAPATPQTVAAPAQSPSWSRWIFNSVSRRWTSIRDRFGPHPAPSRTEAPPSVEATPPVPPPVSPAPVAPESSAQFTEPQRSVDNTVVSPTPMTVEPVVPAGMGRLERMRLRRASLPKRDKLPYDLFPVGFSKELLDKCYQGSRPGTKRTAQPGQTAQAPALVPSSPAASTTPATEEPNALKRKRSKSPDSIPNPPGCSYGINDEYFYYDSSSESESGETAAAAASAAASREAGHGIAENDAMEQARPAPKRARVDDPPVQRRWPSPFRRTGSGGPARTGASPRAPVSSLPPSRTPGFVPNRRETYRPTDLSTIDSSGLLGDLAESSQVHAAEPETPGNNAHDNGMLDPARRAETSPTLTFPPAGMYGSSPAASWSSPESERAHGDSFDDLEPPEQISSSPPMMPSPRARNHTSADEAAANGADENDDPAVTRARHKAEQFKPKTPSRLRETLRPSSSASDSPSLLGVSATTPAPTTTFPPTTPASTTTSAPTIPRPSTTNPNVPAFGRLFAQQQQEEDRRSGVPESSSSTSMAPSPTSSNVAAFFRLYTQQRQEARHAARPGQSLLTNAAPTITSPPSMTTARTTSLPPTTTQTPTMPLPPSDVTSSAENSHRDRPTSPRPTKSSQWLHEVCPTGDMSQFHWPAKRKLHDAFPLVDDKLDVRVRRKGNEKIFDEAVDYWQKKFHEERDQL